MKTVSLCMIVKNEEKNLPRCLESVKNVVDEIIIVDTGSVDGTMEIAKTYGAIVYEYTWNQDFAAARNASIRYAQGDWILILDADDELHPGDIPRLQEILEGGEKEIYFFETHSYLGTKPGSNVAVNLNLRLFKNFTGYYFAGIIHEQLINEKEEKMKYTRKIVGVEDIRIFHYGYLQKSIKEKNKRMRNTNLIKKQLLEEPDNPFFQFNLGSEYFAMQDYKNAMKCYQKVYERFDPHTGYSSKLIIRLVLCCDFLGLQDQAIQYAEEGLVFFPRSTDLLYIKGTSYHKQKKYTLGIRSFLQCLEMGEPPPELKFVLGVGTYRALMALGNIYMELKDYEQAYIYYKKALESKELGIQPLYHIMEVWKGQKLPVKEQKQRMEAAFPNIQESLTVIADLFFRSEQYEAALGYLTAHELLGKKVTDLIRLQKGKCLIFSKKYEDCAAAMDEISSDGEEYIGGMLLKALSLILMGRIDEGQQEIELLKSLQLPEEKPREYKKLKVYEAFLSCSQNQPCEALCEKGTDRDYVEEIFALLKVLLHNQELSLFEKALGLLNLLEDHTVLAQLGKLYYEYGLYKMAREELMRSIKLFQYINKEGCRILEEIV